METIDSTIEGYLERDDYIGAYLGVREDPELKAFYTGRIVNAMVEEMGRQPARGNRERLYFLRSVLLWIFRDIPGLASLYRSQLRDAMLTENAPDILKLLGLFGASAGRGVPASPEEAAETARQFFSDTVDDIKSGASDQKLRDFMDLAGEGLRSGIKGMGDFFDALAGSPENDSDRPVDPQE